MLQMKEMPYHCGLKVKIYPSNEQKRLIAVNDGAKRAVYNHLVACGNEKYRLNKCAPFVPAYQQRLSYLEAVTGALRNIKNALPFLYGKDVDEQAIANAIKNYNAAWKNMKEQHRGIPTFKKKSAEQSYQTNAHYYKQKTASGHNSNVYFEDSSYVTLPKLGLIRFGGSPKLINEILSRQSDIRIGTITIVRDAVGEYWASFQLGSELPFRDTLPKTGSEHGLDLNLLKLIHDSDGESLKVKNLLRNHRMAKAIADAGWRRFLTMLQYKGRMYGKTVILIPPQYTTQTCSVCGHVLKGEYKLPLSVREWDCPVCHTHHHRDTNAARMILQKAKKVAEQKDYPA